MIQPFHEWCKLMDSNESLKNTIVGNWVHAVLQDENMPWNGTCQEIYDYLKEDITEVEAYFCAWEMSGRVVEIDEDYSSETFDEEGSDSYVTDSGSESTTYDSHSV